MVFNPARPEITTVTSESLQAKIRQILPSQDGFGADLAAQNVIVPIIDLTAAAEGSETPQNLQTAYSFSDLTAFECINQTTTIINTTGFYQVTYGVTLRNANSSCTFTLTDGASSKVFKGLTYSVTGNNSASANWDEFTVFMAAGESLTVTSSDAGVIVKGSTRQIATVNGVLQNPTKFSPQ